MAHVPGLSLQCPCSPRVLRGYSMPMRSLVLRYGVALLYEAAVCGAVRRDTASGFRVIRPPWSWVENPFFYIFFSFSF